MSYKLSESYHLRVAFLGLAGFLWSAYQLARVLSQSLLGSKDSPLLEQSKNRSQVVIFTVLLLMATAINVNTSLQILSKNAEKKKKRPKFKIDRYIQTEEGEN